MMKRGKAFKFLSLVCLAALCLSLSACTFYQAGSRDFVEMGGVGYTVSGIIKRCFVSYIEIPEGQTEYEVTIPDKIDSGHKVEGIGGYVGSGAPNPCEIFIENTAPMYNDEYQKMLDAGEFTDYTVTINVGRYVDTIFFRDFSAYGDDEAYVYLKISDTETSTEADTTDEATPPQYIRIKVLINVDSENEYFYSVDGIVYPKETET